MRDNLESLYAYNRWANNRVLARVSDLSPGDYARELGGGWPSVRATLVHLAGATDAWARRFDGHDVTRLPEPEELPLVSDALNMLTSAQTRLELMVPGFTRAELDAPFRWKNLKLEEKEAPLWTVLWHVVNHATYHRGQISSMLKRLGVQPLSTDMVFWGIELSKNESQT